MLDQYSSLEAPFIIVSIIAEHMECCKQRNRHRVASQHRITYMSLNSQYQVYEVLRYASIRRKLQPPHAKMLLDRKLRPANISAS
jgi:hypothetical protein